MELIDSTEVRPEPGTVAMDWGTIVWATVNVVLWVWVLTLLWGADWLWWRVLL